MRKWILASFLLLLSPLCFAQQILKNDIEFITGMPFFYGFGEDENEKPVRLGSRNPSFTGGIGLVSFALSEDNTLGLFLIYEKYYIKAIVYDFPEERLIFNQANITTAENYQFGVKMQFLEAGKFKFPFMVGFSTLIITASANPSLGVTWNMQRNVVSLFSSGAVELHFNESIFLFVRLQATFDIFGTTSMIKYTEVSKINGKQAFYIDQYDVQELGYYGVLTPVIGFGLKLNGLFGK